MTFFYNLNFDRCKSMTFFIIKNSIDVNHRIFLFLQHDFYGHRKVHFHSFILTITVILNFFNASHEFLVFVLFTFNWLLNN